MYISIFTNWLVYIFDLTVLAPTKIAFHIIVCIVSLLGINTSAYGQFFTTLYRFNFDYIPLGW